MIIQALDTARLCCRPFLLQSKASYTQIGIFSVASYPYSFKLFWSPIVDSIYSLAFGRRKSWVVPIQLGSSIILLGSAKWLAGRYASSVNHAKNHASCQNSA